MHVKKSLMFTRLLCIVVYKAYWYSECHKRSTCIVALCGCLCWMAQVYCRPWLLWQMVEICKRLDASMAAVHRGTPGFIAEVGKLCEVEGLSKALDCMHQQGTPLSRDHVYSLLQACIIAKDPAASRRVHAYIIYSGLDLVAVFNDHLIRLYASCKCLKEANLVFCNVAKPSVYTWNAIISAHAVAGKHDRAFELFEKMQGGGYFPNKCIFLCVLKVCCNVASLCWGQLVHDQIIRTRLESDLAVASTLVGMYAKCGRLQEASSLFDGLPIRDIVLWGVMITGYCNNGQGHIAFKLLEKMQEEGIKPDNVMFLCMLKVCSRIGALEQGRLIHNQIIRYGGLESDVVLSSTLIDMYTKCEGLNEAQSVFERLINRNTVSWNSLIAGYAQLGFPAIQLFERMQEEGIQADKVTFLCVLKACGNSEALEHGLRIHDQVIQRGLESDVGIGSTLIFMYAKCDRLQEAMEVFYEMPNGDVVSWGAMIAGYANNGQGFFALELFEQMQDQGIMPIKVTFLYALKACGSIGALDEGRLIHDQIIKNGLMPDDVVRSALIDMYARCSRLDDANKAFDELACQDMVSWGTMIAGYAQHGHCSIALELFHKMQRQGLSADKLVYLSIFKTCGTLGNIMQGRLMHDQFIRSKLAYDMGVGNALVDMYAECGNLKDACKVFDNLPNQDVVSWGALIAGCTENGYSCLALMLFTRMQEQGFTPDKATVVCVLNACSSIEAIRQGRLIHEYVIVSGCYSVDVVVGNSLIDMYCKCGNLREAHKVLNQMSNPDGVSWGSMIVGYAQSGHGLSALKIFEKMQEEGTMPDTFTFSCTLKACSVEGSSRQGRLLHDQIMRSGMETDLVVGNALIDMYSKCGWLCDANKVFDNMQCRDEISWGAMIACSAGFNVLELYARMQLDGTKPDVVTSSCTLKACSSIGAIKYGRLVHDQVIRCGIEMDLVIGTTVVDMYARCGSPTEARRVFDKTHHRNEALWSALISSFVQDGNFQLARRCLNDMQLQGFRPDSHTYTSILAACSHAGRIEEGGQYLKSMKDSHGIAPTIEHFNCMVDTLGRVGQLHEAEELLRTMPTPPDTTGWLSLLTACRTYGNMEVGRQCLNQVVKLDVSGTGGFVMMANIYADAQKWLKVDRLQDIRKCAGAWKKPGQAWLELPNEVREFTVGDSIYHLSESASFKVDRARRLVRKQGFVPQVDLVLEIDSSNDDEDNDNDTALSTFSQNLGMAFDISTLVKPLLPTQTQNVLGCG